MCREKSCAGAARHLDRDAPEDFFPLVDVVAGAVRPQQTVHVGLALAVSVEFRRCEVDHTLGDLLRDIAAEHSGRNAQHHAEKILREALPYMPTQGMSHLVAEHGGELVV